MEHPFFIFYLNNQSAKKETNLFLFSKSSQRNALFINIKLYCLTELPSLLYSSKEPGTGMLLLSVNNLEAVMPDIKEDIEQLVRSKYSMPPKEFEKEELAVQQSLEKMISAMRHPQGQRSLIADTPTDALEDMTKRGQLTIIARNLNDSFLPALEKAMKGNTSIFTAPGSSPVTLGDLYKMSMQGLEDDADYAKTLLSITPDKLIAKAKEDLTLEGGIISPASIKRKLESYETAKKAKLDFDFSDVLLRMYTTESSFYKKLNAIVCGYNDPLTTTPEEKKLALLINVALHKAGLEKNKNEMQQVPNLLFRGQNRGFPDIMEKFALTQKLHAEGKLSTLSPQDLAKINVADIAAKKTLSMTSERDVAHKFTAGARDGVILHVQNPEELVDFYNVQNISAIKDEAEFISRLPDDIVMVPVNITLKGSTHHVEVVCIRSANVVLQNSGQYDRLRDSIKDFIGKAEKGMHEKSGWLSSHSATKLTTKQKSILKSLEMTIDASKKSPGGDSPDDQTAFLSMANQTLIQLYETKPNEQQKAIFDEIKAKIEDYSAVFSDLKVVHRTEDLHENIDVQRAKVKSALIGVDTWLAEIKGSGKETVILRITAHLAKFKEHDVTDEEMKKAAVQIIRELDANRPLSEAAPKLKQSMEQIVQSLDKVRGYQVAWIVSVSSTATHPTAVFKDGLRVALPAAAGPAAAAAGPEPASDDDSPAVPKGYAGS